MDLYSTVRVDVRVWESSERPDPHTIPILGVENFWALIFAKRKEAAER